MTDPLLEEVYRAREKLWQRGGGTLRGMGEYLRECGRRAKERGVLWIESAEEREAIGAEVRARLAREAGGAMCVGEAAGEYRAEEAHAEAQRRGEGQGECTMQNAQCTMGAGANDPTGQRANDFTMQQSNGTMSNEVTR